MGKRKLGFIGDIFKKITGFSESIQKNLTEEQDFRKKKKKKKKR
ncbi:hypothetical protein [Brachyspira hyodysenteriae]|nr:hypothetical protein [Brachyspira hyodysenteriae]MCZ9889021.1 hypothetical protein [Brachyspira hyodysenteriae]